MILILSIVGILHILHDRLHTNAACVINVSNVECGTMRYERKFYELLYTRAPSEDSTSIVKLALRAPNGCENGHMKSFWGDSGSRLLTDTGWRLETQQQCASRSKEESSFQ